MDNKEKVDYYIREIYELGTLYGKSDRDCLQEIRISNFIRIPKELDDLTNKILSVNLLKTENKRERINSYVQEAYELGSLYGETCDPTNHIPLDIPVQEKVRNLKRKILSVIE